MRRSRGDEPLTGALHEARRTFPIRDGAFTEYDHAVRELREPIAHGARLDWHDRIARLLWWPRGVPVGQRIAVAASRLPRLLAASSPLLGALRGAMCCFPANAAVVIVPGAAGAWLVDRAATASDRTRLRVEVAPDRMPLRMWIQQRTADLDVPLADARECRVYVSPSFHASGASVSEVDLPMYDRLLDLLADELIVWHVRRGGNLHRLVRNRLARNRGVVRFAAGTTVSHAVRREFEGRCGPVFQPAETLCDAGCSHQSMPLPQSLNPAPIIDLLRLEPGYLSHCTRACPGPWPGESLGDYADALIFSRADADHSAFGTLRRIVIESCLRGSSQLIRGGHRVVSLTARPLAQLPRQRAYRRHRGRWDFEPFGLSIRREWLESRGARPVVYGDSSAWDSLADSDRPFFQTLRTRPRRRGAAPIEWAGESEWRHSGDLDLRELPSDGGVVFVATAAQAHEIAQFSRWPVTVLAG